MQSSATPKMRFISPRITREAHDVHITFDRLIFVGLATLLSLCPLEHHDTTVPPSLCFARMGGDGAGSAGLDENAQDWLRAGEDQPRS